MSSIIHKHGDLPRYFILEVASTETIAEGDMVAVDSSGKAVQCDDATAIYVVGVASDGGAGSTSDSILVECGVFAMLAGTAAPTAANLGQTLYAEDNDQVSTDRDFGVPAGILVGFDADGDPLVLLSPLTKGLVDPDTFRQSGTATLVAGTVDVDTTIHLNASSQILLTPEGLSGSTNFAYLDISARTDGDIGTASFTITASTASHAADTDCVGDVHWVILD